MEYTSHFIYINIIKTTKCVNCSRKCQYTPPMKLYLVNEPSENSSFGSSLSLKILVFESPLSLGISSNTPWGGHGYFLEPHNGLISQGTNFFVRKEAPYHGPGSYFPLIFSTSLNL